MNDLSNKERKPMDPILLQLLISLAIVILTWVIPSGEYQRIVVEGRSIIEPDSFSLITNTGVSPMSYLLSIPRGFVSGASLIFAITCATGTMEVLDKANSLNIGLRRLIKALGKQRGILILVVIFYAFAFLGGFTGITASIAAFFPLVLSVSLALGYDKITAMAVLEVGAFTGFLCGPTCPASTGLSQSIAGLPLYSGLNYRLVIFAVIPLIGLIYTLIYATKVRNCHTDGSDCSSMKNPAFDESTSEPFTFKHALILITFVSGIALYVYGCIKLGYKFDHMTAIFLAITIIIALLARFSVTDTINTFVKGCSKMMKANIMLAIAYGITVLLSEGKILDTIVYYIVKPLEGKPVFISLIGSFIAISLLNLLIGSASSKAVIIMPIILPVFEILGISSQISVLCYQFGDGITNLCTPWSSILLMLCAMGDIPMSKWMKFIMPLIGILFIAASIFLVIAVKIGYC